MTRHNLTVDPLMTLGSREALIEAVAQGLGVGFMLEQATYRRDGIVRVPVVELDVRYQEDIFCLMQHHRRRTISALFDLADEFAGGHSE